MKKNLLLSVANLICVSLCISAVIAFLASTAALVHWHINPEFYADHSLVEVNSRPDNFLGYTFRSSWTIGDEEPTDQFTLSRISAPSLYMIYLQLAAMDWVVLLILKEFMGIIKSVRMVHTFRKGNVDSFRRIGKYLFAFFVLSSFYIVIAEQGRFYGLYLHLTPLVLMLVAFILGEVFREGSSLSEESQLTV